MCSGASKKRKAEKKAKKKERKAERRQRELDKLAREQEQIAREQQLRRNRLESQQAAMMAEQNQQVATLRGQQDQKLADMKAANMDKVMGIKRASGAAATSLRILGQVQPPAPTAKQTSRGQGRRGSGATSAAVARGSGSTRGFNLSI